MCLDDASEYYDILVILWNPDETSRAEKNLVLPKWSSISFEFGRGYAFDLFALKWYMLSVIIELPVVDVVAGVLLLFLYFWWAEEISDYGRRESNLGPERSKPKSLTTALLYFFF